MSPSFTHDEMLIGLILCKSCDYNDGYNDFNSTIAVMSRIHLFVVYHSILYS